MITWRKLIYLTAFLFIIISLTACGQEASDNNGYSSPAAEDSSAESGTDSNTAEEPTQDEPTEEEIANEEVSSSDEPAEEDVANEEVSSPDEPTGEANSGEEEPPETDEATVEESGTEHLVEIVDFAFSPSKLEIKAGDTVVFINKDSVQHTATSDENSFDTGLLSQDEKEQIVFQETGEFSYYCMPHPRMTGTIVVMEK